MILKIIETIIVFGCLYLVGRGYFGFPFFKDENENKLSGFGLFVGLGVIGTLLGVVINIIWN